MGQDYSQLLSKNLAKAGALFKSGHKQLAIELIALSISEPSTLKHSELQRAKKISDLIQGSKLERPLSARQARHSAPNLEDGYRGEAITWPKISIVTPTYNQGGFIEATILSILNQHYPNLEYIIMDGGSTDSTCEVVNKYLDSVTVFRSEKDKGQSNAINKGMSLATGEILYWLNSDDVLEPNTLMYVGLRYLEDNFDLLTGACTPFDHDSGQLLNRHIATCPFGLRTEDITDIEATWLKGMYFHQPEVFFSSRIWEAAGGYVDEDLYFSMDYDLWVRMAMASGHKAKVFTAGKSFCLFRQHSNQKTSTTEAYLPELLSHSKGLRERHLGKAFKGGFSTAKNYRQKLSIATISDFGFHGGAGIAHKRLCQVLKAAGHEVIQLSGFQKWQSETLDLDVESFKEALDILQPDLVLLGNLHNLKRGMEIAEYSVRYFPTIALAHDFWWITGRCAYTHGCQFLFTKCTQVCPTTTEYPRLKPTDIHAQHQRKKHLLQNPNFYVLANSSHTQTMFREAVEAWGTKSNQVGVVPLPIVSEGEKQLELPEGLCAPPSRIDSSQVRIVLGCTDHADFRKGADLAVLALHHLMAAHPEIQLDVYGRNTDLILESLPEYTNRILLHGYLTSEEQYQELLASGDIFLGTSREETLGQTFVEAAFAGLVTVGPMETGYADVVRACRYSIGYSRIEVQGIVRCVEQAMELLKTQDRAAIRLIQQCQAQASFSGMSFLSMFNHYLYSTGLWKRLTYHAPTKIHDLHYRAQEIDEIVLCGGQVATEVNEEGGEAIETILPISSWKLGPGLYLEVVEGNPVAWLNRTSTFLIPAEHAAACRSLAIGCHWIPEAMRETSCVLRICGFGAITAQIPAEGNAIVFDLLPLREQGRSLPAKLLCSLIFEKTIELGDGRKDLALVCSNATFNA
jgi:glycosyltransferase involved in cell wall biosynthesis